MNKQQVIKDFMKIPSVGKAVADDLWNLGYRSKDEIQDENPETMYYNLCNLTGIKVDVCMKYVFRTVVYYLNNSEHDPQKLKWWYWKD